MNKLINKPLERVLLCCLLSFCLAGFAQETTNSAETSSAEDGVIRATASATITLPIPAELLGDESKGVNILANPASATFVSQDDESTRHAATVSNTTLNQLTPEAGDDKARASDTSATASIANETLANETDASEIASHESNLSDTAIHEASTSEATSTESINNANDAALTEAPVSPETTLNATISNPNSNDVSLDEVTFDTETDDVLGVQEFVDNATVAEPITGDVFTVPVADASSEAVEEARAITELDPEVFAIAQALRCPVCRAESVAESNAPISIEMRQIIQEKLEAGESREEILAYFQQRYNDYILLNPPKRGIHLIVWIAPLLAALIALWLFWRFMKRWTKQAATFPETDADELARVRALLDKETKAQSKEQADD